MKQFNIFLVFLFMSLFAKANYEVTISSITITPALIGPGQSGTVTIVIKNSGTQDIDMSSSNNGSHQSFDFTCQLTNYLKPFSGTGANATNDVTLSRNNFFVFSYSKSSNTFTGTSNGKNFKSGNTITITIKVKVDENAPSSYLSVVGAKVTITNTKSVSATSNTSTGSYVLPIKLNSFTGAKNEQGNLLKWSVSDAVGFNSFQLQRAGSPNGNYETVATVPYLAAVSNYSYQDIPGAAYYRLALVDLDGNTKYSAIVYLPGNEGAGMEARLYPNPCSGTLNVTLYTPGSKGLYLSIMDINGREWKRIPLAEADGQSCQLDVSGLSRGVYILNIIGAEGISVSKKFVRL